MFSSFLFSVHVFPLSLTLSLSLSLSDCVGQLARLRLNTLSLLLPSDGRDGGKETQQRRGNAATEATITYCSW